MLANRNRCVTSDDVTCLDSVCTCNEGFEGDGKTCTPVPVEDPADPCSLCSVDVSCANGICTCDGKTCSNSRG